MCSISMTADADSKTVFRMQFCPHFGGLSANLQALNKVDVFSLGWGGLFYNSNNNTFCYFFSVNVWKGAVEEAKTNKTRHKRSTLNQLQFFFAAHSNIRLIFVMSSNRAHFFIFFFPPLLLSVWKMSHSKAFSLQSKPCRKCHSSSASATCCFCTHTQRKKSRFGAPLLIFGPHTAISTSGKAAARRWRLGS